MGSLGGVSFAKVIAYAVYDDEPIDCLVRNKRDLALEALTQQAQELDMGY